MYREGYPTESFVPVNRQKADDSCVVPEYTRAIDVN